MVILKIVKIRHLQRRKTSRKSDREKLLGPNVLACK